MLKFWFRQLLLSASFDLYITAVTTHMPPRVPIPRLTLFTGGKECSLCEVCRSLSRNVHHILTLQVAKQELAILRKSTAFDLTYWNIRDPPPGADEWEVKKWRRAYQYDIVWRSSYDGYKLQLTASLFYTLATRGYKNIASIDRNCKKSSRNGRPATRVRTRNRRVESTHGAGLQTVYIDFKVLVSPHSTR
jgi:hypothetical protein